MDVVFNRRGGNGIHGPLKRTRWPCAPRKNRSPRTGGGGTILFYCSLVSAHTHTYTGMRVHENHNNDIIIIIVSAECKRLSGERDDSPWPPIFCTIAISLTFFFF